MSKTKVGQIFDKAFLSLTKDEIIANLEGISAKIEERSYTKNLSEEELQERKKEAMDGFKERMKEPQTRSKELIDAIKFKSEQRYGQLFLVDDQENGIMNIYDTNGVCVDVRPLTREERQLTLKAVNNE